MSYLGQSPPKCHLGLREQRLQQLSLAVEQTCQTPWLKTEMIISHEFEGWNLGSSAPLSDVIPGPQCSDGSTWTKGSQMTSLVHLAVGIVLVGMPQFSFTQAPPSSRLDWASWLHGSVWG